MKDKLIIKCLAVRDLPDGGIVLDIDYSDDFKKWFMETNELSEWSDELLNQWINEAISTYIDNQNDSGGAK